MSETRRRRGATISMLAARTDKGGACVVLTFMDLMCGWKFFKLIKRVGSVLTSTIFLQRVGRCRNSSSSSSKNIRVVESRGRHRDGSSYIQAFLFSCARGGLLAPYPIRDHIFVPILKRKGACAIRRKFKKNARFLEDRVLPADHDVVAEKDILRTSLISHPSLHLLQAEPAGYSPFSWHLQK